MNPQEMLEKLGNQVLSNVDISSRIGVGGFETAPMVGSPSGNGVLGKLLSDLPAAQPMADSPQVDSVLPTGDIYFKTPGVS